MMKEKRKTLRLVTSSVCLALSVVMSMIKVFELPFGGSVTLFSMVPVLVLSYMYGVRWGVLCAFVYGVLQMVLGATTTQAFAGLVGWSVPVMALLDYIVAFVVLGFAGVFKNKLKNHTLALSLGCTLAIILRLVCHFFSGWILWGSYASSYFEEMNNAFSSMILSNFNGQTLSAVYSLVYNASYMIPELVLSLIAVAVLMSVKPIREKIILGKASV